MAQPKKTKVSGASLKHAFREIIWPRRGLVALGLALIVINRLAGMVMPAASKWVLDVNELPNGAESLPYLLAGIAAAVTIQAGTTYALTILLSVEAQHLIAQLRSQVQKHVLQLPVRIFDDNKSGELVSRIMEDVQGVRNLVGTGLVQLVGGVITAIVAGTFLIRINPIMTSLAIVPLAAFGLVSTRAFKVLRPAFRERGKIRAAVTGRLTESLGGVRIIKGFHAVEQEGEIFEEGVLEIFENVKKSLTTSMLVTSLGSFFMGIGSVLVLGYGGRGHRVHL